MKHGYSTTCPVDISESYMCQKPAYYGRHDAGITYPPTWKLQMLNSLLLLALMSLATVVVWGMK